MKYHTPKSEDEILPNKLGLKDLGRIAEEEYRSILQRFRQQQIRIMNQ